MITRRLRFGLAGLATAAACAAVALAVSGGAAVAGGTPGPFNPSGKGMPAPGARSTVAAKPETRTGEIYIPTIWIDPDGCEHWAMDDGAEGYMDIRLTRDGKPVCHRTNTCAVINSDQLFATDSSRISAEGRRKLQQFFTQANAFSYNINGHTDSRASDAYNMGLSKRRAEAVATVARSVGARIATVRWYGEREPLVPNTSAHNMQLNRRVEIQCIR
ncbi:OmpA family protein [Acidimangrovimonas sediminis]|uniref:OmpA family protein n=1 Tax=Acidimangrovimonas sediminis TaxID=2056283 RepID=UPI0038B6D33C